MADQSQSRRDRACLTGLLFTNLLPETNRFTGTGSSQHVAAVTGTGSSQHVAAAIFLSTGYGCSQYGIGHRHVWTVIGLAHEGCNVNTRLRERVNCPDSGNRVE